MSIFSKKLQRFQSLFWERSALLCLSIFTTWLFIFFYNLLSIIRQAFKNLFYFSALFKVIQLYVVYDLNSLFRHLQMEQHQIYFYRHWLPITELFFTSSLLYTWLKTISFCFFYIVWLAITVISILLRLVEFLMECYKDPYMLLIIYWRHFLRHIFKGECTKMQYIYIYMYTNIDIYLYRM